MTPLCFSPVPIVLLTVSISFAAERKSSTRAGSSKAPVAAETNTVESLTAAARESVVVITQFGRDGKERGVGAGFVVSEDGLVATSLHVVGESRPVRVQLADGRRCEVTEIHASDRKLDLAILRVVGAKLRPLRLGDSDALKQGAPVIAIGNPLGLEHSVVQGVVSARRDFDGIQMIQLAIPIEPGNSGGPLLDMKGRVQGVLTLKSALTPNLGFAMPVKLLQTLLDRPNPVPIARWLALGGINTNDWASVFGANWRQRAGRIEVDSAGDGFGGRALLLAQQAPPERPFEIGVDVKLDDESGAAGLVFASDGADRHYGFYPSGGQLRLTRFDGPSVYSWTILKQVPSPAYRSGDWNRLRVRVEAEKLLCYVNGELVAESNDDGLREGRVGLAKFRETRAQFREFAIGTNLQAGARGGVLSAELARRIEASTDEEAIQAVEALGAAGPPTLNDRATQLEREATRLRRLAAGAHRRAVLKDLVDLLAKPDQDADLLHAALLVAKHDNLALDVEPYRRHVEDMAREVRAKLAKDASEDTRLAALTNYLFAENGFHGSRTDYYNRANSYLNEVIDDREGLPITLSVLFIELARRIGVDQVVGLPLPGHFMVGIESKSRETRIIDVFNGGRIVSRGEAQDRVMEATGEGFRESDLRPATKREIIVRMLHNLSGIAEQSGTPADVVRYLDLIVALTPDSAGDRMARFRARLRSGNTPGAKEDLQWLIDHKPRGLDVDQLMELYRSL